SLTIGVGVFKHEEFVGHGVGRPALGVTGPRRHPEAALGVERHLHWADEFRELLLAGKQTHLATFRDRHVFNRFFAAQEHVRAVRVWAGFIGLQRLHWRQVGVRHL